MDLWQTLTTCNRPILLYGMGNGADKIIAVLENRGMTVTDYFASDSFVRGQVFHGKTVLSASEALCRYPDAIVLLAFGSARKEVLEAVGNIAKTHTLLVPDVPVFGTTLFEDAFYEKNREKFGCARNLLADERSRQLFDDLVSFKLSGNPQFLWDTQSLADTISECLHPASYRHALDLGAYVGDTAELMLSLFPNVEIVTAWEPDPKTFVKLCRYAEGNEKIRPMQLASLDYSGEVEFTVSGNRNASIDAPGKVKPVPCASVDEAMADHVPDFIKIDVEGAERRTLIGCKEVIGKHAPDLVISLYHRSEDLYDLPLLLHSLNPNYRMYLRRDKGLPAWDIVLCATAK